MFRLLVILALASVAWGGEKIKNGPTTVDGKRVARLEAHPMGEMVSIFGIKAYRCVLPDEENKPVVILTGTLVSSLPTRDYTVLIEIGLWRYPGGFSAYIYDGGVARIRVDRPEPGKQTRFTMLVDEWITPDVGRPGEKWLPAYTTSVKIDLFRPNQANK